MIVSEIVEQVEKTKGVRENFPATYSYAMEDGKLIITAQRLGTKKLWRHFFEGQTNGVCLGS